MLRSCVHEKQNRMLNVMIVNLFIIEIFEMTINKNELLRPKYPKYYPKQTAQIVHLLAKIDRGRF